MQLGPSCYNILLNGDVAFDVENEGAAALPLPRHPCVLSRLPREHDTHPLMHPSALLAAYCGNEFMQTARNTGSTPRLDEQNFKATVSPGQCLGLQRGIIISPAKSGPIEANSSRFA